MLDKSLSTKEYTDPHLDEDSPMCVSGLTICAHSRGLGASVPQIIPLCGGFWDLLDGVAALQFLSVTIARAGQ